MESVRHSTDLLRPPIGAGNTPCRVVDIKKKLLLLFGVAGVAFVMREKRSASPLKTFKVETSSGIEAALL